MYVARNKSTKLLVDIASSAALKMVSVDVIKAYLQSLGSFQRKKFICISPDLQLKQEMVLKLCTFFYGLAESGGN